jgi:hypothetical protein
VARRHRPRRVLCQPRQGAHYARGLPQRLSRKRRRVRLKALDYFAPLCRHPVRAQARWPRTANQFRSREGGASGHQTISQHRTGPTRHQSWPKRPARGGCGAGRPKGLGRTARCFCWASMRVTKTTGRQIIRMAANNAWGQLPFASTVVRNPSVHAQDVQGAHRVEVDPFPHVIAESDIAIKLVPRLASPDWAELSLTRWGGAVRAEQPRCIASSSCRA